MRRKIVPALLAATTLLAAAAAHADDAPTTRRIAATLSSGTLLPEDHVYRLGEVGYAAPPTLYAGLSIEGDVSRHLRVEAGLGVELALGVVLGSSLRFVPLSRAGFSLALGAGPLVTLGSNFGTGVFGGGDVEARYVLPKTPFVVAVNLGLAFALNDAGTSWCGIDTCTSYIRRGDRLQTLVGSLGWAFDL